MCLLLLNPDMETAFEKHFFFLIFLFGGETCFFSSPSHPGESNSVLREDGHLQYTETRFLNLLTNDEEGSGYFCLTVTISTS